MADNTNNPLRSWLMIGLVAVAFLAMYRMNPGEQKVRELTQVEFFDALDKGKIVEPVVRYLDHDEGETYLAGFSAKGEMTSGTIYWLRNGKWDFKIPGISISLSAPDANGWKHGLMSFRIPPEADGFGMQMGVCQAPGEKCWFDNAFYVRAH